MFINIMNYITINILKKGGKHMQKTKHYIFATKILILFILAFCNISFIKANTSSVNLSVGEKKSLSAIISALDLEAELTTLSVKWSSQNNSIARVDSKGNITGVSNGSTKIIATVNNTSIKAVIKVTVSPMVTSLDISKSSLNLKVGQKDTIVATVTPGSALNKSIKWTSSNTSIAIVNQKGEVTGKKSGNAIVTATTQDGLFIKKCNVTVSSMVTEIKVTNTNLSLDIGESKPVGIMIYPQTAYEQSFSITYSRPGIAKYDTKSKTFIGISEGITVATLKTLDGGFKASIKITVKSDVNNIYVLNSKGKNISSLNLNVSEYANIVATNNLTDPDALSNYKITWSSSNKTIATISNGKIKALAPGKTKITALVSQDESKAKVTFTVNVLSTVKSVKLSYTKLSMYVGEKETISAIVTPYTAYNTKVKWSSSDSKIAKVDQNGKIQAVSSGQVTITATTVDGGFVSTCRVTVRSTVTNITVPKVSVTMHIGDEYELTPIITPYDAANHSTFFTNTDKNTISVKKDKNDNYTITALQQGSSKLTITTIDGTKSVDIIFTIEQREISLEIYDTKGALIGKS